MAAEPLHWLDPVCGMRVDPRKAGGGTFVGQGVEFAFCCDGCRAEFDQDPAHFIAAPARELTVEPRRGADPANAGKYTCPMHPEILSEKPGPCPKCGMALEAVLPTLEEDGTELREMKWRFGVASVLAVAIDLTSMQGMGGMLLPRSVATWAPLLAATLVVFGAGWPLLRRGWSSVTHREPNMFTLISLGVLAAFAYSVVAVLAPGVFPENMRMIEGGIEPYFDTAAEVVALVLLGQVLELRARSQTGRAIRALLGLAPKTARRVGDDGAEADVPLDAVIAGDHLRVRPGEKIPVDGAIVEGSGTIDESMLTGEPMPIVKMTGEAVSAGTLNTTGSFVMRAEKVGADTLLARIARAVAEAQRSRAPIQRLADRVSAYFVPAVVAVAAIAFVAWLAFGPEPRLAHALVSAVAVLIIACPCALGLATPMAIMVGTGKGAQEGVLVRDAASLERFEKVDTLVFDKTGTLTEGRPQLVDIHLGVDASLERVLSSAAALESSSEHPLARAVLEAAHARRILFSPAKEVTTRAGLGLEGEVSGRRVRLGSAEYLVGAGVGIAPDLAEAARRARERGETVVFVSTDGAAEAVLAIADPLKPTTPAAISRLRAEGIRLIMATGDHEVTARAIARRLGIDEVHPGLLPGGKLELVRRLRAEGRIVAMAGDGVNDAPAIAEADVGIAMGTGTDIAIESAGFTLLHGDLRGISKARALSRATVGNIRQNLFLAFVYNGVGVPVAAGALYPLLGTTITPVWASVAMGLSSVSVIGNALRLRRIKL